MNRQEYDQQHQTPDNVLAVDRGGAEPQFILHFLDAVTGFKTQTPVGMAASVFLKIFWLETFLGKQKHAPAFDQ